MLCTIYPPQSIVCVLNGLPLVYIKYVFFFIINNNLLLCMLNRIRTQAHFLSLSISLSISLVRLCFSPLVVIQFDYSMSILMYLTISYTSYTDIDNTNKKLHNKHVTLSCDLYDDLE